jgi:uncharacterized membrane protein YphA (DoxX/SURF4 family)
MDFLHRVELWGDKHHPKWLDFVRIALGIFLCYKAVHFLTNMSILHDLMALKLSFGSFAIVLMGHYIVFAHLVGGICLILGVLTRFACLIQIPILLGAVLFINFSNMWRPYGEIILSVLVLLLLIYFLIIGNGPLSMKLLTDEDQKG